MVWETATYTVIVLLLIIIGWEFLRSKAFSEGFTDGVVPEFFGRYFPRRYDVVPGQMREEGGWVRNPRYFEGYVDIQKLGYKGDFCRVVEKEGDPETRMVACALAGEEGLDALTYRTDSARSGTQFSRDDYFRDVNKDGRDDYGRILKITPAPRDTWEARVILSGLSRFKQGSEITDTSPPPHIADLLWFFEGAMVWYRFFDDMLDYAENTQIQIAGKLLIDEDPRKEKTKGLGINRRIRSGHEEEEDEESKKTVSEQFIKIGENSKLEFDSIVQLRQLRAVSVWVRFDDFTNNARIFDFGNGPGHDNVFLGIEGRGNTLAAFGALAARPSDQDKVCQARPASELSPQMYMATSDANVDDWHCPGPEPMDSTYPEDTASSNMSEPMANLLFEIWDTQQRKMRIRVLNAIPLRKWIHVAITTTDSSSFRPTWRVYLNGKQAFEEIDGHMPLKSYTTNNYIGRSNWEAVTAEFQDADERFSGSLFDFRLYRQPMSQAKIDRTVQWGFSKLDTKAE